MEGLWDHQLDLVKLKFFFLLSCEKQLLSGCSKEFKSVYYQHFVDDIFLLFKSSDHFQEYFYSKHPNLNFSFENNAMNKMAFFLKKWILKAFCFQIIMKIHTWYLWPKIWDINFSKENANHSFPLFSIHVITNTH